MDALTSNMLEADAAAKELHEPLEPQPKTVVVEAKKAAAELCTRPDLDIFSIFLMLRCGNIPELVHSNNSNITMKPSWRTSLKMLVL